MEARSHPWIHHTSSQGSGNMSPISVVKEAKRATDSVPHTQTNSLQDDETLTLKLGNQH